MQVHPLGLWNAVTFDLAIRLTFFAFLSDAVPIASCVRVTRYRVHRRGGRQWVCFVLLSAVVKRQSLPDVLQLLHVCKKPRQIRAVLCVSILFALQSLIVRKCAYPDHTGRWGQTLSDRLLSEESLITAAEDPEPE